MRYERDASSAFGAAEAMNAELHAADPGLVGNDAVLAAVLAGSGDCIKILDLDGKLQFMSEGGKKVMEVDDFNALKGCPWPDFWQEEGNLAARTAVETARSGTTAQFYGAANTAKGNPRYWDVKVAPILGHDGKPSHLLSISRDITETRLAQNTADKLFEDAKDSTVREAESVRRLLQNAPSFMCVLEGPHHVFKITNNAYLQLVGHRDLIGLPVREALPEIADQGFYELLDGVYTSGQPFIGRGIKIAVQRKQGGLLTDLYLNFVYQPVFDATGNVTGIFVEGSDVTDLKHAEFALRDKELQLSLALDAAEMGVWESTLSDGAFINVKEDARARAMLGTRSQVDPDYADFVTRVHPDDRPSLGASANRALAAGGNGILDVEYRMLAGDGLPERWIHARAQAVPLAGATRFVGTVRNITDRKDVEAQQHLLRGELQHRIKNTLAMVSAIASQTLRGDAIAAQRQTFSDRLSTLGHAHDLLLGEAQDNGSIQSIITTALAPHIGETNHFELDGPDFSLSPRQTLSMALAVHELATNATKYGALSTETGRVRITWSRLGTTTDDLKFSFKWEERDGPPVVRPSRIGFGSRLVSRVFAADFQGDVTIEYLPEGLVCTMVPRTADAGESF